MMNELNDITLKKAFKGNKRAFKTLYDHYSDFIWKILFRTVNGDKETATELLQNVFVKVFNTMKQYRSTAAFSTWLYRISYNEAMSHFQQAKRKRERFTIYDDSIGTKKRRDHIEDKQITERILESISPDERFLLVAREVNAISFDELQNITGKTAGSLRTSLSRLKDVIRKDFNYEYTA